MFSRLVRKVEKRIRENKKIRRNMRDVQYLIDSSNQIYYLQHQALNSDSKLVSDKRVLESDLVVSLTTFSKKIQEVHLVIESIAQQSVKPNKIILWLDEDEFTIDNIPEVLKKQIQRGLEVRFCPNYKSYKKIIPTLKEHPGAYIITLDDDVLYGFNMIELFVREHAAFPDCIIGNRGHRIKFDKNEKVLPYKKWEYSTQNSDISHSVLLTGCDGIFYPPGCLHSDVIDTELFTQLCPSADDLWLKIMALRNNTPCKKNESIPINLVLKNHRDIGLANFNVKKGGNDRQFKALLEYYSLTQSDFCR